MKRLILIGDGGNFLEWGAGCILSISEPCVLDSMAGWTLWAGRYDGVSLGEFASNEQAKAVRALWLQAIIAAPDGGLLRWDDEREQVVDELAQDDAVFAEDTMTPTEAIERAA